MEKLTTTLAQLQLRAAALADKRAIAEAALAEATAARQAHRLEGDLADEKLDAKLQSNVDLCRSRLTGLDADIAALQGKMTQVECQLDTERTAAERKAASEKLASDLDAVEKALPNCLESGRQFISALEALHFNFEAGQMAAYLASALAQVEVAAAFVLTEQRGMVNAIANGAAPIPPVKREPAPVAAIEPAPATRTLFATHGLKWTESGSVRTAPAFDDVTLPLHLAERALRVGACVGLDHHLRQSHRGVGGPYLPDPDRVGIVDLDAVPDHSGARHSSFDADKSNVIASANFTPMRVGAERRVATAGPRL